METSVEVVYVTGSFGKEVKSLMRSAFYLTAILIAFCVTGFLCCDFSCAGEQARTVKKQATNEATEDTVKAPVHGYVGVKTCKMCHMPYFNAWKDSTHAVAFDLLSADKKEDANPKCLKCHTTGFGRGGYEVGKSSPDLRNVQCEACHGPGKDYVSVMKDLEKARARGLVYPVTESVCVICHNKESPTFKGFDFRRYVAEGVHKVQKKTREQERAKEGKDTK